MTAATLDSIGPVNIVVKLDAADRDRLNSLATARKRTAHFIMKEAIQRYLREEESEARFISAAEASWDDFEKTRLHITLNEAKTWAKALKTKPKATLPRCHK